MVKCTTLNPTITLDDTSTRPFSSENFIQQEARDQFKDILDNIITNITMPISSASEWKNGVAKERQHNSILINGARGTGKTSFILSIIEEELKNNRFENTILPLEIVDPTLLETKESVLLNIISLISDEVAHYIDVKNLHGREQAIYWQESLRKLARGLSTLDEIGVNHLKQSFWDNPELVLDEGLAKAKGGYKLEKDLHDFIERSLGILKKTVFMLVFDDIDTSVDEGRKILEIIRKYLTAPRLIIVLLGDIELYSSIVRQLQWEKLDPNKTLKTYEAIELYRPQVEHLESQYLTKIIKPENRINLKHLREIDNVHISTKTGDDRPIKEYLAETLLQLLSLDTNKDLAVLFANTILASTLRSVVHLLVLWENAPATSSSSLSDDGIKYYLESFRTVYYTTIQTTLSGSDLLDLYYVNNFLSAFSAYYLANNTRQNKPKLLPSTLSVSENLKLLYLNLLSRYHLKPKLYLPYLLRVCWFMSCSRELGLDSEKKEKDFTDYVGIQSADNEHQISRRLISAMAASEGKGKIDTLGASQCSVSLQLNIPDYIKPTYISFARFSSGNKFHYFSPINFIGTLAAFILTENESGLLTNENHILGYPIKSYRGGLRVSVSDFEDESFDENPYPFPQKLLKELNNWKSGIDRIKQSLTSIELDEIWDRLQENIQQINAHHELKGDAEKMISLYWAAILNAFYIICAEKAGTLVANKTNPVTSTEVFYQKVKHINYSLPGTEKNISTFFDFLYLCPLFDQDGTLRYSDEPLSDTKMIGDKFVNHNYSNDQKNAQFADEVDIGKIPTANNRTRKLTTIIPIIDGWETLQPETIKRKLRDKGYKGIPADEFHKALEYLRKQGDF